MEQVALVAREDKFLWKDRHGRLHDPKDMETRHLFYTFRMLWNHTMPENMRSANYKRWRLHMSEDYIKQAIKHIGMALSERTDIHSEWVREIERFKKLLGEGLLDE